MSPPKISAMLGKVRNDLPRAASLAGDWRATRRRSAGGTLDGLRESGRVAGQQLGSGVTAARHRIGRIRSGGRLGVMWHEATRRSRTARPAPVPEPGARLQAVLLCYACVPGAGSEEGVGWTWAAAAAAVADVTLLTTPFVSERVEKAAAELGLPITVVAVEPPRALRWTATRRWGGFVYYLLWQGAAARVLRRHEATRHVDVVHHVTWATDSSPSALAASRAPVRIWGPVGGTTRMPQDLYRFLAPRARFDEVFRELVNGAIRRLGGDRVARRSTLVLALNHDVEARFRRHGTPIVVEPNCALDLDELDAGPTPAPSPGRGRTALFVARLMGWKGPLLAIETLAHAPDWRLAVLGEGNERARAEALAERLGVSDRVEFRGRVPRSEVLDAFRTADALLFPSFHDSAPWAVGEAAALGCPVVCLDAGGPPLLAGRNGHVVPSSPGADLPERLAGALCGLDGRGEPDDRWRADRLPLLLARWYRGGTDGGSPAPEPERPEPEERRTT